jgi:hypothetical protein
VVGWAGAAPAYALATALSLLAALLLRGHAPFGELILEVAGKLILTGQMPG